MAMIKNSLDNSPRNHMKYIEFLIDWDRQYFEISNCIYLFHATYASITANTEELFHFNSFWVRNIPSFPQNNDHKLLSLSVVSKRQNASQSQM